MSGHYISKHSNSLGRVLWQNLLSSVFIMHLPRSVYLSLLPQVVMLLFWGDVFWSVNFSFFQKNHLHIKGPTGVNTLYTSICHSLPIETQNKNSVASKRFIFLFFSSIPFCFEIWGMPRYSFQQLCFFLIRVSWLKLP